MSTPTDGLVDEEVDEGLHYCLWGVGRWVRWGNSVTCVCHAGSFLALTSFSTTWGWWDIYRACGADGVRPEGGQAPWLLPLTRMCGTLCIFNMQCVWWSVWTSKYFSNWFSVSSFLQIMHLIHFVMVEKVLSVGAQASPDQTQLQTETLKTSFKILLILM